MAEWRELSQDEGAENEPQQSGGFALPVPQDPEFSELKESLFEEVKTSIQSDPDERFARLRFGDRDSSGGDGSAPPPVEKSQWRELETPTPAAVPEEEDKPGYVSNIARLTGQRALNLVGSGVRAIGEVGEDINDAMDAGRFVWDDGIIPSWYSAEEFKELESKGVTENLLTETIPMAFQDRDLGGEKTSSPDRIKEGWNAGDVGETSAAVGTFIAETFIESIPDMIAVVFNLPMYVLARSEEIGEERVRNERLSEALAANPELGAAEQSKIATGYVQTKDFDTGDMVKAAPFAAMSALLERVGAKGITGAGANVTAKMASEATEYGMKYALKEGTKAGLGEAGTEFFQEGVLEYFGEKLGTGAEMSVGEGFERGAFAALAGYGGGQVAGTTGAAIKSIGRGGPDGDVDPGTGGELETPSVDIDPDTGKPVIRADVASETDSFETPEEGFSEAERVALEGALDAQAPAAPEQGTLDLSTPAPQQDQATTPIDPVTQAAPVAAGPEPITAPDEVVTGDDLVTEPAPLDIRETDATPEEIAAVTQREEDLAEPAVSPMIQKKDVQEGFRELAKKTKGGGPGIRKAIQGLGTAIASVFPNAKNLPSLKGTVGAKRIGEYFAALDEEIKIDETLPNLKGFLDAVMASPDAASAVQNINRLRDYVANNAPVIETAQDPFLEQANQGVAAYDTFEGDRKQKRAQATRLADRAVAVDELATTVKALAQEASDRGVEVGAEVNELVRRARSYRESSQVAKPRTLKGGAGATVKPQKFSGKNLDEVGGKLREAAGNIAKQLAAVDGTSTSKPSTAPKKTKPKPKVKKTSAVTEAPAKAKKAVAAKKTSKAKGEKKLTKKQKESARIKAEMEKGQADLAAAMGAPIETTEMDILTPFTEGQKEVQEILDKETDRIEAAKPPTEVDENFDEATEQYIKDLEGNSYNDIRRQAKQLGIKAVGTKAALIERIAEEHRKLAKMVADPKSGEYADTKAKPEVKVTTKKKRRIADPDAVIEVDVGPVATGKQSQNVVSELGFEEGTTLDEALEQSGISKKAAATVKAIIKKAKAADRPKIIKALKEYSGPEGNVRLVAVITEALGGQVAPNQMMDVLQFAEGMAEKRLKGVAPEVSASQEALAEEAAAHGMTVEDYKFMLQETGQYAEDIDPVDQPWSDEFFDMSQDEYENSQWQRGSPVIAGRVENNKTLYRALINVRNGLFGFMSKFTKLRGMPDPGPTNVNDFLDAIMKSLPSSHRYAVLAKRLRQLNLNVPVHIYGESFTIDDGSQPLGAYWPGNEFDPDSRKINLYIGEDADPKHIFGTALHEILHAATIAAYETDFNFRAEIDALYDRATLELDRQFPGHAEFDLTTTETYYGMKNATEFIAEALTNPRFQSWLASIDSTQPNTNRPDVTGLLRQFFNGIKKMLGYSIRNSLLEDVLLLVDENLQTDEQVVLALQKQKVRYARAEESLSGLEGLVASFSNTYGKYDDASLTKLVSVALELKTRAKEFLKAAQAAQANIKEGLSSIEVDAIVTMTGNGIKQARKAIDMLTVGLEAADSGRRHVIQDHLERAEEYLSKIDPKLSSGTKPGLVLPKDRPGEKSRDELLDSQNKLKSGVRAAAQRLKKLITKAGRAANLGFSNRDVIERDHRALFDGAGEAMGFANPVTAYTKAKAAASALARKYERMGYLMLKRLQTLTNKQRTLLGTHMRDITKANIDPTQPLNSAANAHIWTQPTQTPKPRQKKDGTWYTPAAKKPKIRKIYKDIAPLARSNYLNFKDNNPKAAKLLGDMAALTKEIHDTKVRSALYALGSLFEFDNATVRALQQAKTDADVDAIFDPNEVETLTAQLESKEDLIGLTKEEKKALKSKITEAGGREQAAKSAKKILHESSIKGWYFPLRRYGDFVVSTDPEVTGDKRYVSFHSTQEQANSVAAALNEEAGPDGDQVQVSLKIDQSASAGDVTAVIGDLTSRIGDEDTRNRLKGAMAEVLASNAAYQSQLKRANVDGVASDDMARGFEEYVHVSKYTIGDLLVSHKVSKAIKNMNAIQRTPKEAGLDEVTLVTAAQVIKELKNQNKTDSTERVMSTFQKTVGLLGFFNFLGAPSYWMLNATQTYTVTLPYITAKYGVKAPGRLAASQAQVLKAATAAINGKDKSYEGFKANLPPAAQKVVAQLELEGVIQSTIAHEFGDMLSPTALNKMREHALGAPVAKTTELAMQVMEKVPEAVEHFNRISTALAVFELSGGDLTATVDAVQETQFNYDTGNRARLLKHFPGGLGGGGRGLVTPIMMFKTYGIGIARLLYGAMLDVAYKKGGRAEAMKLAAGLITTHTLFGGVAGGLMMAPVMAIQAAANAMFKEPDDEWDLEEALELWGDELLGDWFGTMLRRGVPTAVGVDMSRSVNLGNLIWMGNDRLDPNEISDVKQGIAELALGPVGQYGMSAWVEGRQLLTGHNDGGLAEFAEAAIPFKVYRGVSQAVRYNLEGLTTGSDLNMLTPDEFTNTVQTALGFQSVQKTATQDKYYSDQALDQKRSARKLQLMERANNAVLANDTERLSNIFEDIDAYNLSVPKSQYRISAGELARLRSRRRTNQRDYDKEYRYSN